MKGSPRLAARRPVTSPMPDIAADTVVDAAFGPVAGLQAVPAAPRRLDVAVIGRRLWQAVIAAAVLNVVLIIALVVTRGEIPGIWSAASEIGPGATVRIASPGLVARAIPANDGAVVADLPEGGALRISGRPVEGDGGLWWPVDVETENGTVSGYVPQSWVQSP